ncbi:hypothetical protein Tco_0578866 [Tanacetum coccineum]
MITHADDEIFAGGSAYVGCLTTAQSHNYVPEFDPEADLEEDDDEDPEEDPVDYPVDGGDDGDDEEGSLKDESYDRGPICGGTERSRLMSLRHTPPHPAYRVTARISIPAPVPMPVWSDAEVARLLAISTPPSSPLSPWSSPLPQIPSPSLPLSPPSLELSLSPPD